MFFEARAIPKSLYDGNDKFLKKLELKKEENRKLMEEKYKDFKPFEFISQNRPSNKEKVLGTIKS